MIKKRLNYLFIFILLFSVTFVSYNALELSKGDKVSLVMNSFNNNLDKYNKNEIVVTFKNNNIDYNLFEYKYNFDIIKKIDQDTALISFDSNKYNLESYLNKLNSDYLISVAEPNYLVKSMVIPSNDPLYEYQWSLYNRNYNFIDIGATTAWNYTEGSNSVIVGIIDTGIAYNHPDLINNIWINTGEMADNGLDDDGNGYIDDIYGYDFYNYDNNPMDDNGHGTHIAGIIAGMDNDIGIIGIAPKVKVMALKAAGSDGSLYVSDIISAINYAKNKGVKIFNLSFGMSSYSSALYDSISSTNALFVSAAGNGGGDYIGDNNDLYPYYPASYNLANIISVASLDEDGSLSVFSNYGATTVDIAAPGGLIASTYIYPGEYMYMSGTSMATPHVAGAAALALSVNPSLTITNLKNNVIGSKHTLDSLNGKVATGSILDLIETIMLTNPAWKVSVSGINNNIDSTLINVSDQIIIDPTISPANATNKWINWTSSNPLVASVDYKGQVTALSSGTAIIYASTADLNKTDQTYINVSGVNLESYNVIYDGNGHDTGIVPVDNNNYLAGETFIIRNNDGLLTKGEYTLIGWNTMPDLSGTNYLPNDNVQIHQSDITLYANWEVTIASPSNLVLTNNSNSILLNWDLSDSVDGYEIYRSSEPNANFVKLNEVTSNEYVDNNTLSGNTYYYKVRSYKADTTRYYSLYSETKSVILQVNTPTVSISNNDYQSVKLTFNSNNASLYYIYRSTSLNGTYSQIGYTDKNEYINTGLTTGVTYYYKVRAYANGIYSNYSSVVSSKPVPNTTTIYAVQNSYNSIKVYWNKANGASRYYIYRSTSLNGKYTYLGYTTNNYYINTGLTTNTTYYYQVRTWDNNTYGYYTNRASAKPIITTPNVTVKTRTYNSLSLSWPSVSGATRYYVYRATNSNGPYTYLGYTSYNSYISYSLTAGKTYYYKVRASRGSIYSNYSEVKSNRPIPSTTTYFTAYKYSSTSNRLNWYSVSGATGYVIYYSQNINGPYTWLTSKTSPGYTHTNLKRGVTHYYKIVAYRTVNGVKIYGNSSSIRYVKL